MDSKVIKRIRFETPNQEVQMSKTKEMIRILFPDTKNIDEVSETIDKYRMNFGVNTDLRLAMFLAQVREEIGTRFEPKVESLNYTVEALTKTFKSISPDQAKLYGRTSTQKANQEATQYRWYY